VIRAKGRWRRTSGSRRDLLGGCGAIDPDRYGRFSVGNHVMTGSQVHRFGSMGNRAGTTNYTRRDLPFKIEDA
jgi:hypothetical protein